MLLQAAKCLADYALEGKMITQEEYPLYEYAYLTLFQRLLSWGTVLIIGLCSGHFVGTIGFFLAFLPLRVYAGGVHAERYSLCYFSSTVAFLMMIGFYQWVTPQLSRGLMLGSLMGAIVIIALLSPVEDPNKPLDHEEQKKYRRKVNGILVVISIIALTAISFAPQGQFASFIGMGIWLECLLVILGRVKNRKD